MTSADFSGKSKDETIEYLVQEHNSMEFQMLELRQELADARETKLASNIEHIPLFYQMG